MIVELLENIQLETYVYLLAGIGFIFIFLRYMVITHSMKHIQLFCLIVGSVLLVSRHEWWVYGAGMLLYGLTFVAEVMANGVGVLFDGIASDRRRRRRLWNGISLRDGFR